MAVGYNPSIVTNGLVLCLDAANQRSYPGSGTAWSELVTSQNATLTSGPTYSTENGGVINYDGTDDTTTLPLANLSKIFPQITVSIWQNNSSISSRSSFWANESGGGRTFQAHIPWSDNNVYWDAGGAGAFDRINKVTIEGERTGWHNWTFTKNINTLTMRIYLDGIQWHSGSGGGGFYQITPSTAAFLGSGSGTFFYSGKISHFSIYDRELSAGEILQNFNALKGRFGL